MRIVLKVGTSTLAHPTGLLNIRHVEHLCKVVSDLKNAGHEIILVSAAWPSCRYALQAGGSGGGSVRADVHL